MAKYTKEDIINLVKENGVRFIRLQFTDIFGSLKNVAITERQLEKALDGDVYKRQQQVHLLPWECLIFMF